MTTNIPCKASHTYTIAAVAGVGLQPGTNFTHIAGHCNSGTSVARPGYLDAAASLLPLLMHNTHELLKLFS